MKRISILISWPLMLLMLLSSTGLLVNAHVCQDKITSISLFLPASVCSGACEKVAKPNGRHGNATIDSKACCQLVSVYNKLLPFTTIHQGDSKHTVSPSQVAKINAQKSVDVALLFCLQCQSEKPPELSFNILDCTQCFQI